MKRLAVALVGVRPSAAGSFIINLAIVILVAASVIAAAREMSSVIRQAERVHDAVSIGVLVTALMPIGAMIFWGIKAVLLQVQWTSENLETQPLKHKMRGCREPFGDYQVRQLPQRRNQLTQWCVRLWRRQEKADTAVWMGGAFCASLGVAIAVLALAGTGEKGIITALRLTGRLSFLLFWPAYAGSAIAIRFGIRFGALARHGREFGLAFASAQLVHFGLVVWLITISHRPLVEGVMPFFAIGIVWTYLLALFSVDPIRAALSPGLWRVLRNLGLEYIALVFFADFVLIPPQELFKNPIVYLPFSTLLIIGIFMRMSAITPDGGRGAKVSTVPVSD